MNELDIPHAVVSFIDRHSQVPREILVVATKLPRESRAGPEAAARQEFWNAIAERKAKFRLHGEDITWGDDDSRS
jgi:hypothetical protein